MKDTWPNGEKMWEENFFKQWKVSNPSPSLVHAFLLMPGKSYCINIAVIDAQARRRLENSFISLSCINGRVVCWQTFIFLLRVTFLGARELLPLRSSLFESLAVRTFHSVSTNSRQNGFRISQHNFSTQFKSCWKTFTIIFRTLRREISFSRLFKVFGRFARTVQGLWEPWINDKRELTLVTM